jgi:hypothetical protein
MAFWVLTSHRLKKTYGEEHNFWNFRFKPEELGSKILHNICIYLLNYTESPSPPQRSTLYVVKCVGRLCSVHTASIIRNKQIHCVGEMQRFLMLQKLVSLSLNLENTVVRAGLRGGPAGHQPGAPAYKRR